MLRRNLSPESTARFQVVGPLGSGSFGAVCEVIDVRSGQHLAIKELDHASADNIARFKQEFRALAGCHHPNLVGLQELIEKDGRWQIVMELVPGSDLTEYINGTSGVDGEPHHFDERRLRGALSGMVEGLRALHAFGILHRDLKPSNVRVRPNGRAVLLDFGLATSVHAQHQSTHGMPLGTVRYMAPEQTGGQAVGPAADLYALGVCLFEAMTGRAPFESHSAVAILLAKQQHEAPLASSLVPTVPADLDALCARLLALDPSARPSADEVLMVLGGDASGLYSLGPSPTAAPPPVQDVFAGRERELEHLERALAATHRGELRVVLVEGESGVGKSELVAEFLRRSAAAHPTLTALRGRCYENEQVSYKAFDGCIDELSKLMRRMPEAESAALLPLRAALLAQLFPVLRNVRALAKAPREATSADPTARRLEAFDALAALLGKLAEERPLVLVVDDLQWADAESFRMLQALTEHSPPPPLLLLATIRPRDELEVDVLSHIKVVREWKFTDIVSLFGLPREQAKNLAAKLLGADAAPGWLDAIADESDGHPLFLSELVHYTRTHDLGSRGRLTLEAALRARLDRLDPRARELLEVVALAARPHGSHVFAKALSLPNVDELARSLLSAKLLRVRKGQELGCYHDRIRHTAIDLVSSLRAVALHRQLAQALADTPDVDPAEQAHHWDAAGDSEQAIAAYELAGARALETLAFGRAAQLCARAIELIGNSGDLRAQRLTVQRAHALACAGRSREAAALFQDAADRAHGEARVRLRSRAAQHLMLGARMAEGVGAARALLVELGVSVPLGTVASLVRFIWDLLVLAVAERVRPSKAAERPDTAERPLTLEVLEQLLRILVIVEPLSMLTLSSQHLRLVRHLGTRGDAAYALTGRGWLMTVKGSLASALPLFEQARKLIEGSGTWDQRAEQAYGEGSARIAGVDFAGGRACLVRAEELAREHCPDSPWLITHTRYHLGLAYYHLGEHARLASAAEGWLAEVRERNDALGEALLCGLGHCFLRHLINDAPELALEEQARIAASIPALPFSFAHFGLFMAKTITHLYQGGPIALRWLQSFEPVRKSAAIFSNRVGRDSWQIMWQQALLHACCDATGDEQKALLREARRSLRLPGKATTLVDAYGALLEAQLEALAGKKARALELARTARARFESMGHDVRHNALYLEGMLEGGDGGRDKREQVIQSRLAQGWRAPLRMLAIPMPALQVLLEAEGSAPDSRRKLLLGRYELVAMRGGSAATGVVVARDVHTQRTLALKELARGSGKPLERFKREFRALQDLHHDNLGRLDALLEHEGRWYIALELAEGTGLLAHVRPSGRCDLARVTSALTGIARGLALLHDAGFVHRDVTPANILVTADGRPVLVDFGLIARAGDAEDASPLGSPDYASPEQLHGARPLPSSDIYALGVCLFECLLGRLPFGPGTPTELLAKKSAGVPRSVVAKELTPLYDFCLRMLAPEASARPPLREVLENLQRRQGAATSSVQSRSTVDTEALQFSGREAELSQLSDAFERTCDEGFTFALVEGESGVGKSALVSEFAQRLSPSYPTLQVLYGRCYENEQLAFKAFDGAVDRLARVLRSLTNPQCEAVLPKKAALLAQLFPVLTSVPAIALASKKGLPADPAAQKFAAQKCFVELLANLSAHYELLFVVDDLQWADSESFALLRALLAQRERLPILFLCTARPSSEIGAEAARELSVLRGDAATELIDLSGLGESATCALATQLNGGPIPAERLAALVAESKGHPLFLRELIAHDKRGVDSVSSAGLTLYGALRGHIRGMSETARELLALAALSGRPLGSHVFALAMEGREVPRDALIALLANGFLSRRGDNELSCYHDQIRRSALDLLTPDVRKKLAGRLAAALETARTGEPAERARLWDEANEGARAIEAYELAGGRALESLAFTRAEQHYARALELLDAEPTTAQKVELRRRLLEQRGHALVRAGRSAEAARVFQLAAERADGEAKVRLRIWAAQHLVQSAQVDEGMRAASDLLGELGLALPASDGAALRRIAWERAQIKLRGTALRPRKAESSQAERLILEALHGLSSPVRAISYLPGSTLVMQYLRRALRAGEPVHAARALAFEALFRTLSKPTKSQNEMFERSRELAERTGEPALIAEIELTCGLACLVRSEITRAPTYLSTAHEILQARCPGQPWLLTAVRSHLGSAWFYSGDWSAIARHTGAWVEEARAREDRYAFAALAGNGCATFRHLLDDRPDDAVAEIEAALAPWPAEPFSTHHLGAFSAMATALSYGRPDELLPWLDRDRERRRHAYLMQTPTFRSLDCTLTLLGIVNALASAQGEARQSLLSRARSALREMKKTPSPATAGAVRMFGGILALAQGNRAQALLDLSAAGAQLTGVAATWAYGAQYLEGAIEGGELGRAKCEAIKEKLQSSGFRNPQRGLAFVVPALRLVEG